MTSSDPAGTAAAGSPAARPRRYTGASHLGAWYSGDLASARAAAAEKARRSTTTGSADGEELHLGRTLSTMYSGDLASLTDDPS